MIFLKKHKHKIILALAVLLVLVIAFFGGGDAPSQQLREEPAFTTAQVSPAPLPTEAPAPEGAVLEETPAPAPKKTEEPETAQGSTERTGAPTEAAQSTEPAAVSGSPAPIEPENASVSDKARTCTLSVRCDTILGNMARLTPEKQELIPKDGVIFQKQTVTFYEGESVLNLLAREMKKHKIHFEFVNTPAYNSAYIEGIGNLYESDCGELSGWMYRVNGWFPNYGCSRYPLKEGDNVEFVYTCDLGADVGGDYSSRNGM